jgi:riboflavin kinase/FMN adenylyltransferase
MGKTTLISRFNMQVHFQIDQLPAFKNAALTVGTFDGVHNGHRVILEQLKQEASLCEGESVVITFHPHPRRVLSNADAPSLLTGLEERIERFQLHGIDHLVVVAFDHVFAEYTALDYVEKFLVALFHPKVIVIGHDHRFGKDRKGDYALLDQLGERFDYRVKEIPEKLLQHARISSTGIRHALLEGDIEHANRLLGYRFALEGVVIEGDKLGRTLGFPTANLSITDSDKLIPSSGVYAVEVELLKTGAPRKLTGMMNIGYRPTVNGRERRIEVHIFHFDEDIYHERLKVFLIAYTRKEMKFAGLEMLKARLHQDRQEIQQLIAHIA